MKKSHIPWIRLFRALAQDRQGVAATEFALIASVLVLLLMGAIDFGAAAVHRMQISNAVRAGTQYALIRPPVQGDVSAVREAVVDTLPASADPDRVVAVTFTCRCPSSGPIDCAEECGNGESKASFIRVSVEETHELMIDWPVLRNPLVMRQDMTLRIN